MKQKTSKKLAKLVLCSVLAASVCGNSVVFAAGTIKDENVIIDEGMHIVADKGDFEDNTNRYAVIGNTTNDEMTVTAVDEVIVTGEVNAPVGGRAMGIINSGKGILNVNGTYSMNLNGDVIRSIRNSLGNGVLNLNGSFTILGTSESGNSKDAVVGIEAFEGSEITINGDKLDITMNAKDARYIGVQNFDQKGKTISLNSKETILNYVGTGESAFAQGVLAYQSNTYFNGNTVINMKGSGISAQLHGVDVQCDPNLEHNTNVEFNGSNTSIFIENAGVGDTVGVRASGATGHVKFSGDIVEFKSVNTGLGDALAIRSQYGAKVTTAKTTSVTADVTSTDGKAMGIEARYYAGYFGFVDINGDLKANVSSLNGEAKAISVVGDSIVNVLGNVDIISTGQALYASNSYLKDYDKDIWDISTNGAIINLGSTGKTVSLTGDVVAEGSTINLAGETTINGELSTANDGNINFTAGNVLSSLNIASGSNVNLTGATMKINDFASAITGDGKLTIKDNGIIETTSDKVFTNTASATNNESGAVLDAAIGKVNFIGGTVNLTDNEYTIDYAKKAQENMSKVIVDGNGSKTQIVMSGNLASGNVTTVDEASKVGSDVALDKVTVNAEKNLIVGTDVAPKNDVEGIDVQDAVTNGFNVGGLNLADGSTGMVITNDKKVTVGGSVGGTVVTVNGKEEAVKVVVGTNDLVDGTSVKEGTFNIGNALATADTEYTLNGSVTVNAGSDFNTKGQINVTENITLAGGVANAEIGKLETKELNVTAADSTVTGNIKAENLNIDADAGLNVGNAENAGNLVVKEATLNGGVVFLDPEWKDGVGIDGATNMAVEGTTIDGTYAVGRNSILSFGVDNTAAAQEVFAKTGLDWSKDGITAAMYIADGVDVTEGAIIVDGALDKAPAAAGNGTVNFADNSLLMVNGENVKDSAAISGVTSVKVDAGSKLFIDNAKKGETYKILAGTDVNKDNTWYADKDAAVSGILSDNALLKFVGGSDNGVNAFDVTAALKKVSEVYGDVVVIDKIIDETLDKHESSAAADFFNAAVSSHNNATTAAQVDALNASANIGELGGSSRNTYVASNLLTDAVAEHMSLANEKDHDQDIWAHYVHSKENVDGLALGGMTANYDTQYNGIVVGADLYKNGKGTIGTALTYIDGSTTGSSLASSTKNDATYYGMSIYGGVVNEDSAVIGDISYLHGKNDITQHNSGATLTAEPETDAFSIGVKAERSFKAGNGKIVPYAGLRYMHLGTGNYANSIDMNYDVDDANLFLLPVGVKYSTTHKTAGWTLRPIVEVGYVWTMGDRDIDQTVSLNGASNGFGFNIADSGAYIGRFAVEAEKANVTYGLGYEYQKGDSTKYNKWMANVNWKF